jgi:hypothetical protein
MIAFLKRLIARARGGADGWGGGGGLFGGN